MSGWAVISNRAGLVLAVPNEQARNGDIPEEMARRIAWRLTTHRSNVAAREVSDGKP